MVIIDDTDTTTLTLIFATPTQLPDSASTLLYIARFRVQTNSRSHFCTASD